MIRFGQLPCLPWLLLACGLLETNHLRAQTPAVSDETVTTLHAYANLIQLPVLVLSSDRRPVPPVNPDRFSLSIDNGPWYRPTHVRTEGADPLSLTIVLDFDGEAVELMPKISEIIEHVTAQGLTSRDHVSLMVMQCALSDLIEDMPAQSGLLQPKIAQAINAWTSRHRAATCAEDSHLWDTLLTAALRLSDLPGRRVIIAVSDGVDRGSSHPPEQVAAEMQSFAVTTFAVQTEPAELPVSNNVSVSRNGLISPVNPNMPHVTNADPLQRLSELSGGIALRADRFSSGKQFARIPELLRGRYILDFPRPAKVTAGGHSFAVKVAKSDDFIRSSGISVPLPDPGIVADPTTLPNDPALTPQMGKSKKIPPPLL